MMGLKNTAVQIGCIILCFAELLRTDAYYIPYLIICVLGVLCTYVNGRVLERIVSAGQMLLIRIFSGLFALMITMANYEIWEEEFFGAIFSLVLICIGSYIAFYHIFLWLSLNRGRILWKSREKRKNTVAWFIVTFSLIFTTDLLVLILCEYPGVLSYDSIHQMNQIMNGAYTNHHPFYHTMTIKLFVDIGMTIFHDITVGVALYSLFQIFFMAINFAIVVAAIHDMGATKWITVLLVVFYTIMPYHIMYSMTMWKDVMFASFVMVYTLFLYRCVRSIGNKYVNDVCLFIYGLGV